MPTTLAGLQKRVGQLLRAARQDKGWTQQKLADESRVSREMIARIERGQTGVRFPNLVLLANALEIDPAQLFFGPTQIGPYHPQLNDLMAKLAVLPDLEQEWVIGIIDAALKPHS